MVRDRIGRKEILTECKSQKYDDQNNAINLANAGTNVTEVPLVHYC